jgi:hypothetical protein
MTSKFYKVEGHSGLMKDPRTGVVINTNSNEIAGSRKRKLARVKNREENENLKREVQDLKSEMTEIKDLLKKLIEK